MDNTVILDNILPLVKKPGRYVGGEAHCFYKDPATVEVTFALVFPDLYEIGMSHFGLQILYHILNRRDNVLAERCFAPDVDMEQELRRHGFPLTSIESRRPLADFDVIGITLPYELCFTNILTILDLAGLPLRAGERSENDSLVIGGGTCSMNPEPVADFFDAIVLGDGEEVAPEIAETVRRAKKEACGRRETLIRLARIAGVYVPSFFEPRYRDGVLTGVIPLLEGYETVRRRVLPRLPDIADTGVPLVPVVKPVHDRLGIEIARGCTRGCRFCQAGIIYRPVRERPVDEILAAADRGIGATGFEELALLSLSSGDYSCMPELITRLMDRFADQHVSVSMPSMRVGTLTPEIMEQIRRVRKTGFTVAPEAGTDRLREVINKGITEADLLDTCRNAFAMGWNLIKLYFMIGLPTETGADIDGIIDLAARARQEAGENMKRVQINVSVGTFVPKPHTPFQWERQLSLDEARERIDYLKARLPRRGFKLKWHDPRQSMMEGVFSRGDRQLSRLIETAWRGGVRLDGWSEHYRLENWRQAAGRCGIDLESYLRARERTEALPWDHLHSGVDRAFLEKEHERAMKQEYTPDCRTGGCKLCGLCDFKTVKPVVCPAPDRMSGTRGRPPQKQAEPVSGGIPGIFYRVHYTRLGDSRWYSHLEILQLIFRGLRRIGVAVLHSQGFNPTPRVSFGAALPVGMESAVEYFDMKCAGPVGNGDDFCRRLSKELPPGMEVFRIELKPGREPGALCTTYEVALNQPLSPDHLSRIDRFLREESRVIERIRKRKRREIDIRPLVVRLEAVEEKITFELVSYQGKAGVSPREILVQVVGLDEQEALLARMVKTKVRELNANP